MEEKDEDIVVSIGKRLHVPAPLCSKLYVLNILGGNYFSKRVQFDKNVKKIEKNIMNKKGVRFKYEIIPQNHI